MGIRISLFGQPRAVSEDGSQEFPLQRKTLNVLAYLILNRKRPPTRDSVAFALFPDEDEEKARNSLRRNLSYLISALPDGKQFINTENERIAWNADAPAHVDVLAFEDAAREGRDEDALAEYAGQLLPTLYDEWTTADRERLRDTFHEVLIRTIARERSQRRFDLATAAAHRLLDEDPWREDVVRQLMAIRYEAGDRAGALAAFERFAVRLRDEMQAQPMPESVALRDAVLRGAQLATSEPQRSAAAAEAAGRGLPFVGRAAYLQRAQESWHAAADGSSGMLFVMGEAGVGKSRFVTELARLVESEGGVVVRGHTSAGGEHRPYETFVDALQGTPDVVDDTLGTALTDDRAARVRLFESVRHRLTELSRTRVLVLVLEDLHWAGPATIDLLEFIVRRLESEPVLVVATFRDDELPRAHPLRALRRQLQGRKTYSEIALERLSIEDATSAMQAALPDSTETATIARAVEWADGVPLLLAESMRDLAVGRPSSAPNIAALVGERFERLSSGAETALVFGAVLGERFELSALATVTGWRDDEIVDAIGESIECGLLRATSRTPGLAFAFRHELIRVAAIERIPTADRVRAHGLVARALCADADEAGARAGEIAQHFAAAGETTRATEYYSRAARYALDVFANDDACEIASLGLALCDENDPAQRQRRYDLLAIREEGLARTGDLERRRADAHALVSLAAGDETSAMALERLFKAHRDDASTRTTTLAALSNLAKTSPLASGIFLYSSAVNAIYNGEFEVGRDMATRAAEAFDKSGERRSAALARYSIVDASRHLGEFEEAAKVVDGLRADMESSEDLAMRAEFHRVASVLLSEERRPLAIEDARQSLAFALRIGDRFAEARARHNLGALVSEIGEYEEALDENARALAAYRDISDTNGARNVILNTTSLRLFCGDFTEAERLLGELGASAQETPFVALRVMLVQGVLEARLGRLDDAERLLLDAYERASVLKTPLSRARAGIELAMLRASDGRLDEADAHLAGAIADLAPLGQPTLEAEAHSVLARLRATRGDAQGARDSAERTMGLIEGTSVQSYSQIGWNVAAARALVGDNEDAMQLASSAVAAAVSDARGMSPDLAEAYFSIPWHQQAMAYLWGRPVALRSDGKSEP